MYVGLYSPGITQPQVDLGPCDLVLDLGPEESKWGSGEEAGGVFKQPHRAGIFEPPSPLPGRGLFVSVAIGD